MNVYEEVRARDRNECRACKGAGRTEVHHIVFRSQGGTDTVGNLITLCESCHRRAHNTEKDYIAPWELLFLVNTNQSFIQTWRNVIRHDYWSGITVRLCLNCEYRTEAGECPVWEHPVDWDYSCDVWKERDAWQLIDCHGERKRRRQPDWKPKRFYCQECRDVVNLHVKDDD